MYLENCKQWVRGLPAAQGDAELTLESALVASPRAHCPKGRSSSHAATGAAGAERAVPAALPGSGDGGDERVWKWLGAISLLFTQATLLHVGWMSLQFQFRFPIN